MLLSDRLRTARAARGWRQADLADAFGVNQATICRVERNDIIGSVTARLIEMQLDKLEHDNPLPVVGMGEPPTGSAREEAAMPRGSTKGTKRTAQKRSQSTVGQNYQLPAAHKKQFNQLGKGIQNLNTQFQAMQDAFGGAGATTAGGRGGRGGNTRSSQSSQNL